MIIPAHQELAQLVARNISRVGDASYSSNCGATMCCGRPLCEINMYLLFFFIILPWLLIIGEYQDERLPENELALTATALAKALLMPRNVVAFLVWGFTFSGVGFTLKRRDVRMSDTKAGQSKYKPKLSKYTDETPHTEELRAFFRARGFGLLVREQGFFARRRRLSLSAGLSAAIVASVMAYIVWGVGGLLGYPAHP